MSRTGYRGIRLVTAVFMLLWQATPLLALPKGGEIISGDVSIEADGDLMTVHQESQRAIVHYDSFNLEVPERIEFIQPSSSAAILNRVVGGDASEIAGVMVANGHVYLINPNGIVFSSTARIDVGGLIASAMNLRNSDFLAGKLDFYEARGRKVVNKGDIKANHVYLIGNGINNLGSINAADVILASGTKSVEIDTAAGGVIRLIIEEEPEQAPAPIVIDNDEIERMERYQDEFEPTPVDEPEAEPIETPPEEIVEEEEPEPEPEPKPDFSDAGMIINEGLIEAAGPSGGTIVMQGTRVGQLGTVRADATVGDGGTITIYGEEAVALGADSLTTANAGANGVGGDITVLSPGITLFRPGAKIEAKGGSESGDGGDVEVSGYDHVEVFGTVDTSSENGKDGTFLIDPADVFIRNVGGAGDGFWMGTATFEPDADDAVVPISVIQANLLLNSVEITTTEQPPGPHAGQSGNITVENVMTLAGTGNNTLRLQADNDIIVNAAITFTDSIAAGSPQLLLRAANDININADITTSGGNVSLGDAGAGPASVTVSGNIDTGGGIFSSEGVDFTLSSGSRITTDGGSAYMASHSGSVDIQDEIDTSGATGGDITIGGSDIMLTADLTTDAGDITIWNPLSIGANISIDTGTGAGNVTFVDTVDAGAAIDDRELYIAAGSGTVDFQGSVGTTEALEWLTVGAAGRVNLGDVTTRSGGIDVAGTTIDLSGTLATDAAGNAGSIMFMGAVELSGDTQIDTDHATGNDGNVTIFGTLDADLAANNRAMEFTQGSGNLLIRDATGSSEALDSFTVNSAGIVNIDAITTRDGGIDIVSASGITLGGDLSTDANPALAGSAGNVALSGPITISGNTVIDTDHATGADGTIQTDSTIDADDVLNDRTLEFRAGDSDVTINQSIGSSEALLQLTLGGGNVNVNGDITATDTITVNASDTLSVGPTETLQAPNVLATVDDIDLQGSIDSTATTITDADGSGVGLGATVVPGGVHISGTELQNISATTLDLNTAGNMVVATVSQANSDNAGTVTLDAGGSITFETGESVFNALTVEADDGIVVQQDITTDTGDLSLDGDADDTADTTDDIQFTADVDIQSAGSLTLESTTGDMTALQTLELSAENGIIINDSLVGSADLSLDTDVNTDGVGSLTVAAGATLNSIANNITIFANDINLPGSIDGEIVQINDLSGVGTGLGDTSSGGGLDISGAELQNITASDLQLSAGNNITVDNITAAQSANAALVTISSVESVQFANNASFFQSLDVRADNGIAVDANVTTLAGELRLDGDYNNATDGDDAITFADNVEVAAQTDLTLESTTAGMTGLGVLRLVGRDDIVINSDLTTGGDTWLSADNDNDGDGDLTIAAGVTVGDAAQAMTVSANDIHLPGALEGNAIGISDTDAAGIGVGASPVAGGLNLSGDEMQRISAATLSVSSGADLVLDGITAAQSAGIGVAILSASEQASLVNNESTFNSAEISANDGVDIDVDITTLTGNLAFDGDVNNVAETRDDVQIAAGTTLTAGGLLSLDATSGGIDAAGDLTLTAAGGVTANDSITVAGQLSVDSDSDRTLANGGMFTIAAGAAVDAGANAIDLTVGDLDVQGTLSGGSVTITDSDGSGMELGDTLYPRDVSISGAELQNITAADLLLRTDGLVTIDGISATESDNVNDVVIDTSRRVTFLNGASTFDSLTVQADDGIYAETSILTDTGALALDGDADNAVDGNDHIQLASGVMLSSATELSLDATSGGIEVDGLAMLYGRSGVTINDSITPPAPPSSCNIMIHADIGMPDGNGTFTLASGATLDCGAGRVSVTANDIDLQGNMVGGLAEFDDSDASGIGLGDTAVAGGLNIGKTELQNIGVDTVTFMTSGDITVDNIEAADSDNITDLTLDSAQGITFINNDSTFNAVTVQADDRIGVNVDVTTDTGNLVMDGDADNAVDTLDMISFASGRTLSSAGSMTLDATSGDMQAGGPMTLNAANGITLNDSLTIAGTGTLDADSDASGGGTLTIAAGAALDSGANRLELTADDASFAGTVNGQTVTITDSDGTGIGLGDTLTAGNLSISGTELANVTAFFLELDTAGSVEIDNVTAAQSDAAGIVTLNANQSISFLNNASTFDSLIVLANNGIRVNTDVSTDEEGFFLDGDADNAADGSDDIQFADGVTLDSEGMLRLDATSGKMTGSGDVTFNANNTITLNDSLTTAGDQQYNNNLTAANGVTLRAGEDLTVADGFVVRANGSMDMYADHDLTLGGDASSAGHIDLRGDYDGDLDGQLWIKGDISTDGATPAGTITLVGDMVVDGSMTVGAPNMSLYGADRDEIDYDIAAPINAGGIIIRMGHDITDATGTENDLLIANRVELTARTGAIGGAGDADIDMNAGQLKANGRGNVYIEESDSVKASGGIKAGGTLDLMVHGTLSGDRATSGRNMMVETKKDLTIKKLEAGGKLDVDVGGKIDSDEFRSGDKMAVQAGGSIDSDEFNSGDMMTIQAGDSIDIGILYAEGDMDIDGNSLIFNELNADYVDGDLASHIYVGRMDVDGVVDFNAGGSILDNNSMVSAYDVLFRAGGNIGASAINLDVHQITLVQADGNVHITQHRKQDTSLGLVSAGGRFKVEVPGGGLVDGNGDGLNLEAYADSYLSLHGTCGLFCDGLDVLIEGGNLSVDAINITDKFTEDSGSWISLSGTINPAGDEEQIVYIGEGEAPGLVLLNRELMAGHVEITPEIRRTTAFAVETPEIRPKQGVFSSPYFLHNYMYVSEPMAMGLVDYILHSQAEVRADPQFTKTAKREITMWPEGYVW